MRFPRATTAPGLPAVRVTFSGVLTWDREKLRPVQTWLQMPTLRSQTGMKIIQRPRRSQTGLSSFSDQYHKTQEKKCMEADTNSCWSGLVPVSCKYPLNTSLQYFIVSDLLHQRLFISGFLRRSHMSVAQKDNKLWRITSHQNGGNMASMT